MMIINLLPLVLGFFFTNSLYAYTYEDVQKLKNDKEVVISSFSKRDKLKILEKYNGTEAQELTRIFYETMLDFINDESKQCESDFYNRLVANLNKADFSHNKKSIEDHLKLLRSTNVIDDVLYDILSSINEDEQNFKNLDLNSSARKLVLLNRREKLENNNLEELYSAFKNWPDEKTACSTQEFLRLKEAVTLPKGDNNSTKLKFLETLNYVALERQLISLGTYNRLEFFRTKSSLEKRYIWLNDYLKTLLNAKNSLRLEGHNYEIKKLDLESRFSTERLKRFSRITRRKVLYKKYNDTQIIMLAQVLQKASRRMGVDPGTDSGVPYIFQEFSRLNEQGERETYVEKTPIDPQSQYNLARRLMRKDIVELQMMGIFNNINITYEDLVMASFETGYITFEDIEFVVKYDDLWNPATAKYERMSKFAFSVAGYTTFFLPPPFNIAASLALGVVEGVVDNKLNETNNGENHDNPGTFIE